MNRCCSCATDKSPWPLIKLLRQGGAERPNTVLVFTVELTLPRVLQAHLAEWLSSEERERASRLRSTTLQNTFVVSHALLRLFIASSIQVPIRDVTLALLPGGKPYATNDDALKFSMSRRGEYGIYALARGNSVGVDIEQVDAIEDATLVISHFFGAAEQALWRRTPAANRSDLFTTWWVCKEAFTKASGMELGESIRNVHIGAIDTHLPTTPTQVRTGLTTDKWFLWRLPAPTGYRAALCIEHQPRYVRATTVCGSCLVRWATTGEAGVPAE